MHDRIFAALVIVSCAVAAAAAAPAAKRRGRHFALRSPAILDRQPIPKKYTCDGEDVSPPLAWERAPEGAKSFALVVEDPDAPAGTWVHWVVYDIPASARALAEGLPKTESLPSGAKQGASWGVESFERVGWSGPCPPPGKRHRYFFTLYALKSQVGLPPRASKPQLVEAMAGKILAKAQLLATYER